MPNNFCFPERKQGGVANLISDLRDGDEAALAHHGGMNLDWIEKGLQKPGKNRVGLAKALGRSPSMVTSLLSGRRQLKASEVGRIARYLDVEPPTLPDLPRDSEPVPSYLEIRGEVAGGVWSEPGLLYERISTRIPLDPRWPADKTYLLRVRGSSINRRAQDGDLVVCLDAFAAPRKFQPGDWVIAERERAGLVETTVKKVGVDPDGDWALMPDSDDPQFQQPIPIGDGAAENVRVCAFVLQFLKVATPF